MSEFLRNIEYLSSSNIQAQDAVQSHSLDEFYNDIIPFSANTQEDEPEYELPDLSGDNWVGASLKKEKILGIETGYYIYTTTNGTTVKLKDTENTVVKENSETGEIVIIGADNSVVTSGNSNSKMSIYDSHIDKITGNKYDEDIALYGSYFNDIDTKGGNDAITMFLSEGRRLLTGVGEDEINVLYSDVYEKINTQNGNDIVAISNSNLECGEIDMGDGSNFLYANKSELESVGAGGGTDEVYIDSSNVKGDISTSGGNDTIIINAATIGNELNSGKGDDIIKFIDSDSASLDAGKGENTIIWQGSSVSTGVIEGENNALKTSLETGEEYETRVSELDEITYAQSEKITEGITSQYTEKELTPEEELQLLFVNDYIQNTQNMRTQFENQENEDGLLNDCCNFVKAWLDLGISKEDIEDAINKQEQASAELLAAFNGESDETFEEAFKRITGVEYSQENILHWQEVSQKYNFAAVGVQKAQAFKENIRNASNMQEAFDLYVNYFGSEELAREEINKMLEIMQADSNYYGCDTIWKDGYPYTFDFGKTKMYINENNQFVIKSNEEGGESYVWEIDEIESNPLGGKFSGVDRLDDYADKFIADYEQIMNLSFEDLEKEYAIAQIETFGKGNAFQQLLDDYCQEQEGFADAASTTVSLIGMGIIVVGGVVTFVNPLLGSKIMNAGGKVAFAGSLIDNGYEFIDNLTSENGLEQEELYDLLQETAVELALYYSGKGIGKLTQPINAKTLELTGSESLALLSEVGPDAVLSLLTDAMLTGEVDLTGEGISQLIQVVAGIAGVRAKVQINDCIKNADKILVEEGLEAANEYLKKAGIPEVIKVDYEASRAEIIAESSLKTPDEGLQTRKPMEFKEGELATIESNRETKRLYQKYIENFDVLSEQTRADIEQVLNHTASVAKSEISYKTPVFTDSNGQPINCTVNIYSTSALGNKGYSEAIEILDSNGDIIGIINFEYDSNGNGIHIQNMSNYTDGDVSNVGRQLHALASQRSTELGFGGNVTLNSVSDAVLFHYKCGFRFEDAEINKAIEEAILQGTVEEIDFNKVFGEMKLTQDGIDFLSSYKTNFNQEYYNYVRNLDISHSLSLKYSELSPVQFEQATKLLNQGLEPIYAYQIGRLSDIQVENALQLINKGIPASKAADTAVLMGTPTMETRINELIENPKVANYYIADLARLSDTEYNAALRAINEGGITAPSAIEKAAKLAEDFDATVNDIISSRKMKKEITPEIETELTKLAKELSLEYGENSGEQRNMFLGILYGEGTRALLEDGDYANFTSRAKGDNSTLCKLIAKYEKGDLNIDLNNRMANMDAARNVVTDAYGTRVQLKSLTDKDVILALESQGLSGDEALGDFQKALLEMSKKGTALSEEHAIVLDALKEKHNKPVFEALMNAIENKKINLDELNNYGSALSSYFTTEQIASIADLYHQKYGGYLKITTQDANAAYQATVEKSAWSDLMSEADGSYEPDYTALKESFDGDKAIKSSGYTSSQMTYKESTNGQDALGEFQIRGVEVNKFGDVEHIPYDIRQGKITGKDIEYSEIYDAITTMSKDGFDEYNRYLTQVYDYLRLKELGIDLGTPPSIEEFKITNQNNELLDSEILKKLTYEGLLELH